MKKLKAFMSPDALSIDFGGVRQQLQRGAWRWPCCGAIRRRRWTIPKQSKEVGKIGVSAAPSVTPDGPPGQRVRLIGSSVFANSLQYLTYHVIAYDDDPRLAAC